MYDIQCPNIFDALHYLPNNNAGLFLTDFATGFK